MESIEKEPKKFEAEIAIIGFAPRILKTINVEMKMVKGLGALPSFRGDKFIFHYSKGQKNSRKNGQKAKLDVEFDEPITTASQKRPTKKYSEEMVCEKVDSQSSDKIADGGDFPKELNQPKRTTNKIPTH